MVRKGILLLILLILIYPWPGFGFSPQTPADTLGQSGTIDTPAAQPSDSGETGKKPLSFPADDTSYLKFFVALTFVLGLIFLGTWFLKRISGVNGGVMKKGRVAINLLTSTPLGDKKFLSIVEIQEKYFFLGITANSINLLSELDISVDDTSSGVKDVPFENIFDRSRKLLKRFKK